MKAAHVSPTLQPQSQLLIPCWNLIHCYSHTFCRKFTVGANRYPALSPVAKPLPIHRRIGTHEKAQRRSDVDPVRIERFSLGVPVTTKKAPVRLARALHEQALVRSPVI